MRLMASVGPQSEWCAVSYSSLRMASSLSGEGKLITGVVEVSFVAVFDVVPVAAARVFKMHAEQLSQRPRADDGEPMLP